MEEAEQLANELTVIDRGRVIANGGIDELKAKVGGRTLRIRPADPLELRPTAAALDEFGLTGPGSATVDITTGTVLVPILSDEQLTAVVGALTARGITLAGLSTELPSLDEVFLSLTGHRATDPTDPGDPRDTPAGRSYEEAAV
jgi:oleandomycin transport system ATP-binding protein